MFELSGLSGLSDEELIAEVTDATRAEAAAPKNSTDYCQTRPHSLQPPPESKDRFTYLGAATTPVVAFWLNRGRKPGQVQRAASASGASAERSGTWSPS
ncbi:hypothetical protein [Mycolicibacterium neoaurum]|uniref:hypothetical protein n=1 Tax=Mycolicibacterium neoaurum TaxID=1795 RepID=UPI00248BD33D|nr:hypothetical protein [Mycolicibacterium neoaurum]WBP94200.1 hypothetical protein O7W24_24265 [Mycolicibacterium neoaurum]